MFLGRKTAFFIIKGPLWDHLGPKMAFARAEWTSAGVSTGYGDDMIPLNGVDLGPKMGRFGQLGPKTSSLCS